MRWSLTFDEQRQIVLDAGMITGGTIIFYNKLKGASNGKTIYYAIDEDQVHATVAVITNGYAGASSTHDVWNRTITNLFEKNNPGYNGMDILIVIVDKETLTQMMADPIFRENPCQPK